MAISNFAEELLARIGPGAVRIGGDVDPRHRQDWTVEMPPGDGPLAVVYPRNAEEVSTVLRLCQTHRHPVIVQGGLTGLAGGATPVDGCVVLSMERMRAIEEVDTDAGTMTVQAGVTLQTVQETADAAGLLFPLDLGARGSCLIGGNLSTNAGGNRVLRYGMMRDLVLGLEVVLADGTVVTSLNKMIKNNAGYDLKHLFIGTEGTLGVVTRAVLRLHPKPRSVCTALCAVADYAAVLRLLRLARERLGGTLSAFEVMWPEVYRRVETVMARPVPLPHGYGAYVLVEAMGTDQAQDQERFETIMQQGFEDGIVTDAVIAQSGEQTAAFWTIRDACGDFGEVLWPAVGFDVSLPVGRIGEFVELCQERLAARWPEAESVFFGHVADGNIHIGVKVAEDPLPVHAIDVVVYDAVREFQGSISAEHGIGVLKKEFLPHSVSPEALALMRTVKAALDPNGLLNPGKVIDAATA